MKKLFLNWKQNGSFSSIMHFKEVILKSDGVVFFPPFPYLSFSKSKKFDLGAQNVSAFNDGAYTGEVGAFMLKECGANYCLVGHSERRTLLKEDDDIISLKIKHLQQAAITPVLCVGESLEERKSGKVFETLKKQMKFFKHKILVAYEPVWSIGTGLTPQIEEIYEVANFLNQNYNIKPIYGGSVSYKNSALILKQNDISGLLIGGASLNPLEINNILNDNFGY